MKKTDLKVGVDYAICFRPADINRSNPTIHRATLVSLAGSATRETRSSFSSMIEPRVSAGIEIALPITIKGERYKRDDDGNILMRSGPSDGYRKHMTEPVEVTYPTRFLDNARCIIMTWEDWEAKLVRDAELRAERAVKADADAQARTDLDPRLRSTAMRVLEAIGAAGDVGNATYEGSKIMLDGNHVGTFKYGRGIEAETVLLGAQFNFSLSTLAKILGV